tara:strand:+ start:2804 stop:3151 length:348 start_codon:yes stop_codon:yes gene_type:complete
MSSKGIYQYTVQESNNAGLGQGGSVYLKTAATIFTPTNGVIVAIQVLGNAVRLDTLTPEDSSKFIGVGGTGYESAGNTFISSVELPASSTIFGRFTSISLAADTAAADGIICYIG